MSMFENYELIPQNYIPNNINSDVYKETSVKYPLVAYNAQGDVIGFTWNYEDTVYLEFTTTGNVVYDDMGFTEDCETYLKGKKFKAILYNNRYEVCAQCICDAAPVVKILSDSFFPSTVVPGVYRLKLTLIDENNDTLTTLISGDDGIIYIK